MCRSFQTFDELTDSGSHKNGFRYQCLLEGNRQIYHPIGKCLGISRFCSAIFLPLITQLFTNSFLGCLFSGKFYAPGAIIKEGSYSLICREEAGIIRIEPYYYTPSRSPKSSV